MNSHSPTPSTGSSPLPRDPARRPGGLRYASQRQTEAYLLARDAVRRIQRTSSLISAVAQPAAGGSSWPQDERQRGH